MVAFVGQTDQGVSVSTGTVQGAFESTRKYSSEADETQETNPLSARAEARVRYGETESRPGMRLFRANVDTGPPEVIPRDHPQVNALLQDCSDLLGRMLETDNIIERENLYRTLNERLFALFSLRAHRERPFGHLLILILGVTQNTTSEFFLSEQLSALDRVVRLAMKPSVADPDIKDAERCLAMADFDLFRPIRGSADEHE